MIEYARKRAKVAEEQRRAKAERALNTITMDIMTSNTSVVPVHKKTRQTSIQVKADKEAASRQREFNKKCIK